LSSKYTSTLISIDYKGQKLISMLYFKERSVVTPHHYQYSKYMVGRVSLFAKTSKMGIDLGYKGYKETLYTVFKKSKCLLRFPYLLVQMFKKL